ncbi:hypothetical protein [Occultella gossypii]|uniref:Ribbon-helix-helix protein, CopG family n=1 Tax=Occultella gossypii TaxID=2800820 RepID=A0ABS7S3S3_9MICO|nr:hypothetical protein [Occultella gossypii]MBZ2194986.1 hypothetical protein [Occultella gossypii]
MSRLERRMQILLDEDRYARLEREATASGRSVASIVRDAIDSHFASGAGIRAEAGRRLVAEFDTSGTGREPDWAESKAALEDDLDVRDRA